MKKITVSVPGKLMLLGEHAVVYNHPCLVTAVGQRMFLTIEQIAESTNLTINAKDVNIEHYSKPISELGKGNIPKGAQFVEIAVKNFFNSHPKILKHIQKDKLGLHITTKSEFSSKLGFGSSSASTVCTIKALDELFETKLTNKDFFNVSYKTVIDIQKKGSGFDVAAAIYGGTLYFVTGGKTISPLVIRQLPLIVGYSGVKADTSTLINKVALVSKKYPVVVDSMYRNIEKLVKLGVKALKAKDFVTFGQLMNMNQGFLESLNVSTGKLSSLIYAAREAGAYGAKLSGAGGGDCMISLCATDREQRVKEAIMSVGGEVIKVDTNVEGVRVE